MGIMSDYASKKEFETVKTNSLLDNFDKLSKVKEDLIREIKTMSSVLKELNMELVNIDDMLFEIRDRLEEHGVEID